MVVKYLEYEDLRLRAAWIRCCLCLLDSELGEIEGKRSSVWLSFDKIIQGNYKF